MTNKAVESPFEEGRVPPANESQEDAACLHCGLPCPPTTDPLHPVQFCCSGCETVYALLHPDEQCELPVVLQERDDITPENSALLPAYAEMDHAAFLELYAQPLEGGRFQIQFYLEGVHCGACVWLLEKLPSFLDGIFSARIKLRSSLLTLVWDPTVKPLSAIARFVHGLGYPVHPYREEEREQIRRAEDRRLLIRLAIAGASVGNVMLIAFAMYGGMFHDMSYEYEQLFRWLSLALATPAVLWSAQPFFRHAIGALRSRTLHIDLPVSLGIAAGFLYGLYNTARGTGEVYFDSVTMLIFLLLVGQWLKAHQQRKAEESTEKLYRLTPLLARKVEGDVVRRVPVETLVEGDLVEVLADELIPADGTLLTASSQIDASILTGESHPVKVRKQESIFAGTLNLGTPLRLEVTEIGARTRIGRILSEVELAADRKAPVVRFADQISGAFIGVVLVLAAVTFGLWTWLNPKVALDNAVALLIVSCPCALGLATPLSIAIGLGRAASLGIMIKGGDVLESLAGKGKIWLDKTGTLTKGELSLVEWEGDTEIQPLVQVLEAQSSHPIAKALHKALPAPEAPISMKAQQILGGGILANIDGEWLRVGSPAFISSHIGPVPDWMETTIERWSKRALSPVAIAFGDEWKALAGLGDPIREDAVETLEFLQQVGWEIGILSGDHPQVVEAVGQQLGLPSERCFGGMSPEQKLSKIQESSQSVCTVMVGDGVNDAAALAAANVGIGVHGGAEASLANADIFLSKPGLGGLTQLVKGARDTLNVIHRNFVFSVVYNLFGAGLAIAGIINPLWAAVLMPLSSLTVVANSLRTSSFRG